MEKQGKYYFLLSTSSWWFVYRYFLTDNSLRKKSIKEIHHGFPAKWLIFTAVMFSAIFYSGQYFAPGWIYNNILNKITICQLSTYSIISHLQCTWNLLREYNYEKLWGIGNLYTERLVIKAEPSVPSQNMEPSVLKCDEDLIQNNSKELIFDFLPSSKHIINTTE